MNPKYKNKADGSNGESDNDGVICKRGGEACSGYWQPEYNGKDDDEEGPSEPVFTRPNGTHKPLERMDAAEKKAMIKDAEKNGQKTIDIVDKYVDSGKSRLDDLKPDEKPLALEKSYTSKSTETLILTTSLAPLKDPSRDL